MTDLQRNSAGELHHWFTLYTKARNLQRERLQRGQGRQPTFAEVWSITAILMVQPDVPNPNARKGEARAAQLVVGRAIGALQAEAAGIEAADRRAAAVPEQLRAVVPPALVLTFPENMAAACEPVPQPVVAGLLSLEALLDESRVVASAEQLEDVTASLDELRNLLIHDRTLDAEVRRLLLSRVAQAAEVISAARSGVAVEAALERLAGSLLIYAENVPEGVLRRAWDAISTTLRTRKFDLANLALQGGAVAFQITQGG